MAHLDPLPVRLCLGGLPVTVQELLRHLLACSACREALGPWPAPEPAPETAPAEVLGRGGRFHEIAAAAGELAGERAKCAAQVPLLLAQPAEAWPALLDTHPEARSVGFLRELLEPPRTASDPGEDLHRALLALEILLGLGEDPAIPRAVVLDLRVQALTLLAEAHLAAGAWCLAQTAYDSASRLLAEGLGSPEEASFALSLARTMGKGGRSVEALALAGRAADLYARLGDLPRECEACQLAGALHVQAGDLDAALAAFARALLAAEASGGSPALGAGLRCRLAWVLLTDGRYGEAFEILADMGVEESPPGATPALLALLVQLVAGESDGTGTEEKFRALLALAQERADAFETSIAALNLAGLYLRTGRREELAPLRCPLLSAAGAEELPLAAREALAEVCNAITLGHLSSGLLIAAAESLDPPDPELPAPAVASRCPVSSPGEGL